MIFAACALVFTSFLSGIAPAFFRILPDLDGRGRLLVLYVLLDLMLLGLGWLCIQLLDQRGFATLGLWFYRGWAKEAGWGVLGGAALMTVIVSIMAAARALSYTGRNEDVHRLTGVLSLGVFLILAAAFEEIAFRGYAFQRLVDAVGPLGAVAISAGLFGAAHFKNPSATPFSVANTVLAGVLFSTAYLKTRALWLPISLHWAWNFFQGLVFSLPVSGIDLQPTLFRTHLNGAAWLTGGAYGPEGGAAVTAVCVAAIIWLARTRRVAPSQDMAEVLQ
jgi:membrane protease YdiL (CAAX protease family)